MHIKNTLNLDQQCYYSYNENAIIQITILYGQITFVNSTWALYGSPKSSFIIHPHNSCTPKCLDQKFLCDLMYLSSCTHN